MTDSSFDGGEGKPEVSSPDITVEERTMDLLSEARIIFDRLTANIDAINAKILAVFQIFLVLVTLQISFFGFVFNLSEFSRLDWILFSGVAIIIIVTLGYLCHLIWPKRYDYPDIFEEGHFNELCSMDRPKLLSGFLRCTQEAYNTNFEICTLLSRGLQTSLILVVLDLIIFAVLIGTYIVD